MAADQYIRSIHNHCTLCDGTSTPEEMVDAAIAAGIKEFGFSCHAPDSLNPHYGINNEQEYVSEIRALAKRYEGRIRVLCGIEQDSLEPVQQRNLFDYVIGSVHYVPLPGTHTPLSIDESPTLIQEALDGPLQGDIWALVQAYYDQMVWQVSHLKPDIVGHFDLIVKNNGSQGGAFFDENSERYCAIARNAFDVCAATGVTFEINMSALRKGRKVPYLAPFLQERAQKMGVPTIISTDAHCASQVAL